MYLSQVNGCMKPYELCIFELSLYVSLELWLILFIWTTSKTLIWHTWPPHNRQTSFLPAGNQKQQKGVFSWRVALFSKPPHSVSPTETHPVTAHHPEAEGSPVCRGKEINPAYHRTFLKVINFIPLYLVIEHLRIRVYLTLWPGTLLS